MKNKPLLKVGDLGVEIEESKLQTKDANPSPVTAATSPAFGLRSVAVKPADFQGGPLVKDRIKTKREEEISMLAHKPQISPLKPRPVVENYKVTNTTTVNVQNGVFATPQLKKKEDVSPFLPKTAVLYRVKGKRRVFITQCAIGPSSLNESDAFVLVSLTALYCWSGQVQFWNNLFRIVEQSKKQKQKIS